LITLRYKVATTTLFPAPSAVAVPVVMAIMLGKTFSPEAKAEMYKQYQQQGQPIVVPYGTGKDLVHPTNPCIQQYIP
jgi:hypothetical protein